MPSKKNYESLSEGVVIEEKDQEKFKALLEWLKNYDNSFEHSEDNSDCETVSRDTSEDVNNVLDGEVINRETKEDKIAEIERLLLYNYKGFLDKKAFLDQTNGRDGTLVFVDIKSMGVENILAFRGKYRDYKEISRKLRLQISDAEREGDANKVIELKKELKKQKENVLLHSGDKVTLALWGAIQKIKQEITSQFGSDIEVGLGGDEIYFFVPDEKKGGEEELRNRYNFINSIIKEKLANYQLSGRIQMTETKKNQHPGVKEKLTQLDKATAFSKALEKRLASLLKTLGERVFAGTIVDGDDEELELQKRFVEGLHDFRLEVEPRISTLQEEEDKHKDFLGEENCKFDIVFNKVALPVNKKEYKSRFSTQDIFRVEYNEKTDEYNVELKPDSPLITVFKGINLGRTSRKK